MSKKVFTWRSQLCMVHYALCILMLSGLSMSCSDDDDKDGRTAEEIAADPYEKESEAADALYRLVSQLSVCDSLPNDWKTATFEPKAGKVLDQSQPRVRTIAVNNAAEAVARYNSLTGKELPATTKSDTYKVDGVGTLTLNVGGAGTIATIDVDVKQMPQLQQLRLVSVSDIGENGHFKGDPYYRFGDVVRDKKGCYWVCVRPAYSPNGKEDTHWMSFEVYPEDNFESSQDPKKGRQPYCYPVNLGVQKEKMQYLAQLMAIMANPYKYKDEAGLQQGDYFNGTGLGGLQPEAMPIDSLLRQAALWEKNKIWEKVMPKVNSSKEEKAVKNFKERFKKDVTFIYEKGSLSGTNLTIKTAKYTDAHVFYRNEPTYDKVVVDLKTMSFFITNSYTTDGTRGNDDYPVPDAFVVRYKTGFQLSSNWLFNPSATDSIPGVTTVHRFNACQGVQTFDMGSYTKEQAEPRMIMAKNGKFYKSEVACTADGTAPVALVVYVGDNAEVNDNVAYRGLAMSYTQKYEVKWDDSAKRDDVCLENTSQNSLAWEKQNNGIERTQKLNNEEDHSHYAAHDAWMFQVDDFNPSAYGYSRWFLPTAGQAIMAIRGLGGTVFLGGSKVIITFTKNLKKELEDAGITSFKANFDCWTSTEYDSDAAIYFYYENGEVEIRASNKDDKREVRPFIAF